MEKADIVQLLGEKEHLALNSLNIFPNFLVCKIPNFLKSCSNSAHLPPSRRPSLTFALDSWLWAVGHGAPDPGPGSCHMPAGRVAQSRCPVTLSAAAAPQCGVCARAYVA